MFKVHKLECELNHRTLDPSQFDDSKIKYFTGLPNLQTFMLVFTYISSVFPNTAKRSLMATQELLLTLMKLRLNLSENCIKNFSTLGKCHGKQASSPNIVARKRRLNTQLTNVFSDIFKELCKHN